MVTTTSHCESGKIARTAIEQNVVPPRWTDTVDPATDKLSLAGVIPALGLHPLQIGVFFCVQANECSRCRIWPR